MLSRKSIIKNAEEEGRFLDSDDLKSLSKFSRDGANSIKAAEELSKKSDYLCANAALYVYDKFPYVTEMEGPNYASTDIGKAKCVRDINYYLVLITYCLIAGGTGPLDEYLIGIREINNTFELSPSWYVQALVYIRDNHGLSESLSYLANPYFDYAINILS